MIKLSRTQQIVLTVVLSAVFVPAMTLVPIWCFSSRVLRNLLWDLSYWLPSWTVGPVLGVAAIVGFAIPCGVFAWIITRIWTDSGRS